MSYVRVNVKRICGAMVELDMTQTDLAKTAGMSRQSISTILGRGTCSAKSVGKIASSLGLRLEEVLGVSNGE